MVEVSAPFFWVWLDIVSNELDPLRFGSPRFGERVNYPLMMSLLVRGLTYWLAMIPTVLLLIYRLAHMIKGKGNSQCLEILKSIFLLACATCMLAAYVALDVIPDGFFAGSNYIIDPVQKLPLVVISFAVLVLVWRYVPLVEPTGQTGEAP